ncbi:MAG: SpoIIE family protein phosphatase [Planctomycetia bacterium]|nr:SpoIIE family protein phosphatase [Planctomycetia bacterium]
MFAPENTGDEKPRPSFEVRSFGLSHRGRKRDRNEDCFSIAELVRTLQVQHTNIPQAKTSLSSHRAYVFLVADGVGGSLAGEVASGLGVKAIEDFLLNTLKRFSNLQNSEEQDALRGFQDALRQADSRIFEETVGHPEWQGMGTTMTMAFAVDWQLFVAHAGDSRCYLYSGGKLQRLTQDHTMSAEMARLGMIPAESVAGHPWRNVVTNILGGKERGVKVELHHLELHPDDVLLLCSDGLTEMVPEARIAAVLQLENDPKRACKSLIAEANRSGGYDNITALVARIHSRSI